MWILAARLMLAARLLLFGLLGTALGSCFTGPASISVNSQRRNIQVSVGLSSNTADCEGVPGSVLFTLYAAGTQAATSVSGFSPNDPAGTFSGLTQSEDPAGVVDMVLGTATRAYNVTLSCVDGDSCVEPMKGTVSGRLVVSNLPSEEEGAFSETLFVSNVQTQNYDYNGCYESSIFSVLFPHPDGSETTTDGEVPKYARETGICVDVVPLACEFPFDSLDSFKAMIDISDPINGASYTASIPPLSRDSEYSEYYHEGSFTLPYDHTAVTSLCYYCGFTDAALPCRDYIESLIRWPYRSVKLRLESQSFGQGSMTAVGLTHTISRYNSRNYQGCLTDIRLLVYKDRIAIMFHQTLSSHCVVPDNTISMATSMNYYTDPDPGQAELRYYLSREDKMFSFSEGMNRVWFYCRTAECQEQLNRLILWDGDVLGDFAVYFNDWKGDLIDAVYTDITTFQQSCALEAKVYIYRDKICFVTQPSYAAYCTFNQDPDQERDLVLELYRNEYPDFEQYSLHTMARFERKALYTGQTKEICFTCKEHFISASYEGGSECTSQLKKYFEEYRRSYVVSKLEVMDTDILGDKVLFYNYTDMYIAYGVMLVLCLLAAVIYFVVSVLQVRRFVQTDQLQDSRGENEDPENPREPEEPDTRGSREEVAVDLVTGRIGEPTKERAGSVAWNAGSFSIDDSRPLPAGVLSAEAPGITDTLDTGESPNTPLAQGAEGNHPGFTGV